MAPYLDDIFPHVWACYMDRKYLSFQIFYVKFIELHDIPFNNPQRHKEVLDAHCVDSMETIPTQNIKISLIYKAQNFSKKLHFFQVYKNKHGVSRHDIISFSFVQQRT